MNFRVKNIKNSYYIQRKTLFGWNKVRTIDISKDVSLFIDQYLYKYIPFLIILIYFILIFFTNIPIFIYVSIISILVFNFTRNDMSHNILYSKIIKYNNINDALIKIEILKKSKEKMKKKIYYLNKESERYHKMKNLNKLF